VADAIARYLADCHARNLKTSTIDKQRLFLERHFAPWCEQKGTRSGGLPRPARPVCRRQASTATSCVQLSRGTDGKGLAV